MNRWLIDASVLLVREDTDDPHHADGRRLLAGPGAVATMDLEFYEVTNVAIVACRDADAARRLRDLVDAIVDDGGVVRASRALLVDVARLAVENGVSAYEAAYVAAAASPGAQLVNRDVRDLMPKSLALLTVQAGALGLPNDAG